MCRGQPTEQSTDHETGLPLIGLDEVRDHCTPSDGWMVLYDRVYDVTELLRSHPGGEEVMAEYLGYDGTMAFRGVGHSKAVFRVLQGCIVGILPKEERLNF
jgi:cytochrome b involved in lipid metabolism